MSQKDDDRLSHAAVELERELANFEELLAELGRPVTSDKTLERARKSLESCSQCEARLAQSLHAFADAMGSMQARQQRCMEVVRESAERIQARHSERNALLERVTALGARAREVSEPLMAVSDESWSSASPELFASMREVGSRLESVITDAEALAQTSQQADWTDIARDAQALKQQLQAVRNRVLLGERKLATRAPS